MAMMKQALASPTVAVIAALLLAVAHRFERATAIATGGFEYVGYGSCRDNNGKMYSNIRLTSATATHDDSVCGQSCDVFRSKGKLRGFEWLIVDGSSKRCYCLFDAGSDVEAMVLNMGGEGATWKGDNSGQGEIASTENVGIDSYCYKLAPIMRLGDVSPSSPTLQPQSIEEIFEEIFGDNSDPIFTTSQIDVDDDQPGYSQSASLSTNLSTTKSSKIFAGYAGKSSKSKSIKTSKSSSKSSKGLSYPPLEGKADKRGDDPSLLILEQMRYKMGNGGRMSGRRELLLLIMTSIISCLAVRQW